MSQVKIGPEFFSKAKNDYSDWRWSLVREFYQNCIDCGSKNISLETTTDGKTTTLTVYNDGKTMSKTELVDKLLSLGSSGKEFREGSVGGFGKAKELLYFGWNSYTIETGNLKVVGSGAEYKLVENRKPIKGTISSIVLEGDVATELADEARRFISLSSVKPQFTINGKGVDTKLQKGYYRRDLPFGRVYTNKQFQNLVVVRIGGTPMFTSWTKYAGCVVVELEGNSMDTLTSNRDGLQYGQRCELEGFIQDLTTNRRKALKQKVTEYLYFPGEKVSCAGFTARVTTAREKALEGWAQVPVLVEAGPGLIAGATRGDTYDSRDVTVHKAATRAVELVSDFVIKNETGRVVRKAYRPDSDKFCQYAFKVLTIWSKLLVTMHEVFQWEDNFSVGFLFTDNDVVACHETGPQYGRVYYLNPVTIQDNKWQKRFNYNLRRGTGDLNQLAITALHELVHGMGYNDHDEAYASKLTSMAGKLLGHQKEIRACFK